MQKTLEILHVEHRDYTSKKTGKKGSMHFAQCVIHSADGTKKIGELLLPEEFKDTAPGVYGVEFGLDTDFEKRVVAKPTKFVPASAALRAARVA